MIEKIEKKIDEIIESIISKNPSDISYSEYKIIDCRCKDLKYQEEQKHKNEEMAQVFAKTFGYGFGGISGGYLPEPEIKEE